MPQISNENLNTREYWDNLYAADKYPTLGSANLQRYRKTVEYQIGNTALEIGCGQAGLGLTLLEWYPHVFYHGIDHSMEGLQRHKLPRDRPDRWHLTAADWQSFYLHRWYDTVYLCEVLEHTPSPKRMLDKAVLAARYRLVVTVPIPGHPYEWHRGEHMWDFQPDELKELLAPYGPLVAFEQANIDCWVLAVDVMESRYALLSRGLVLLQDE